MEKISGGQEGTQRASQTFPNIHRKALSCATFRQEMTPAKGPLFMPKLFFQKLEIKQHDLLDRICPGLKAER